MYHDFCVDTQRTLRGGGRALQPVWGSNISWGLKYEKSFPNAEAAEGIARTEGRGVRACCILGKKKGVALWRMKTGLENIAEMCSHTRLLSTSSWTTSTSCTAAPLRPRYRAALRRYPIKEQQMGCVCRLAESERLSQENTCNSLGKS